MGTVAESSLLYIALLVTVGVGLAIRRRIPHRPTLGAWIVVGSCAVGIALGVAAMHWRHQQLERERMDHLVDALDPIPCAKPAPTAERWRQLYEVKCSPACRDADVQGAGEHRGVSFRVQVAGDRAVTVWIPRPDARYRLWLVDGAGKVIDTLRPDPSMISIVERPGIAAAAKVIVTLDPDDALDPRGAVIAEAALRPRE